MGWKTQETLAMQQYQQDRKRNAQTYADMLREYAAREANIMGGVNSAGTQSINDLRQSYRNALSRAQQGAISTGMSSMMPSYSLAVGRQMNDAVARAQQDNAYRKAGLSANLSSERLGQAAAGPRPVDTSFLQTMLAAGQQRRQFEYQTKGQNMSWKKAFANAFAPGPMFKVAGQAADMFANGYTGGAWGLSGGGGGRGGSGRGGSGGFASAWDDLSGINR